MANKINLDELKQKGLQDPFPAPEGYFNDFSQRIQQQINNEAQVEKRKVVQLTSRWYYAAAAIAILVIAIWLINPLQINTTPIAEVNQNEVQNLLAEVNEQDLIDYLQMNSVDMISAVSLTEEEQEELLESELESYDLPDEYYLDTDYLLEEYL
ncbi:MAG: hypothetical protein AAF632_12115 [Bacteroidota bacterium]